MKKLLATLVSVLLLATMIPLGAVSVGAASNIVINGVDIGYASGSYFTKNGGPCYCHTNQNVNCLASQSNCNCMRYWPTGYASTCQVDLMAVQCFGYARYCQWKVYGYHDRSASSYYVDITGAIPSSSCTGAVLKSKLLGCAPATHVRTKETVKGYGHSISIIGTSDYGVVITDCNYGFHCEIRTATYSWNELATFVNGYGGVAYANAWNRGNTPSNPITYATIETGTYFIKNKGTGKYLDVSQGKDEQLRNILVFSFHGDDNQKFEVTKSTTTAGYAMRPLSSASRKVNVEADTVVSGKNVCIYDDIGHDSQRWNFEAVDGGYVIRNVQVPSCVLDVEDGENVYVSTYTGAASQIWTLESVDNSSPDYEYAMFPMEYLNITQGVNGSFSHQGTKAIDIAGKDSGIDAAYAPFTGVVKRIYKEYVVWLESSNPVMFADGTIDYMTIMVVHDNDTSDLYVGKVVKQGEHFFDEGTTGYATGNHIHLECGKGKFQGNGWYENSQGNWVIYNSINPYDALYLSSETVIKNDYGYGWKYVPSTPSTSITYATIDTGVYAIKNKGNQLYMNVAYGLDENAQNIHTYEFGYWNSQLYEITPSTTTAGYMMRPLSSASRVVNVYADNVVSGKNVCIYDNTEDGSQRWNFEKVEDGFVIRNVQNPSCVLTVPSGSDVSVQTYSGADNQIWTLENVVSYDANGGTGAPELQLKNYNESITLSTTKPSKDGYVFKGWATDASATEAQYVAGGEYNHNVSVKLYAVWECDHTYEAVVTNPDCLNNGYTTYTCSMCGDSYVDNYIDFVGHSYTGKITTAATCSSAGVKTYTCSECGDSYTEAIPATGKHSYSEKVTTAATCGAEGVKTYTCSACGDSYTEAIPATGAHTYDDEYDADCNTCGAVREVPDKPTIPDLPADAPAFVVENTTARAGEEFTVAIRTQRNSGIVSFKLNLGYDADVLELVSIEEKDFAGMTFSPLTNNPVTLNWVDAIHPNNTTDGVVALVTFRVKDGASVGETAISVSYEADDVYDQNFDNVGFRVENGVVEIVEYIPGDVTGEGKVNNKDLGLLQQYLNGWEVTISEKAADVTGDGKVNNKDLGLLQQYLNGYDVTLG